MHFVGKKLAVLLLAFSIACLAKAALADGFQVGHQGAWGTRYEPTPEASIVREPPLPYDTLGQIRYWNQAALNANALDHTPVSHGEKRVFGEQFGPARTSRAFAIVHIAMFEAVNAIDRGYQSYTGLPPARAPASMDAAIAQAAHDTLTALFPSQKQNFDRLLAENLRHLSDRAPVKKEGIELGRRAAASVLALRDGDGSEYPEPVVGIDFITSDEPGKWRQDPISGINLALGAHWGEVKHFVITSDDRFWIEPPPPLTSDEYTAAFNEVKRLGGDGIVTPTERTEYETITGKFWSYDGTPGLGTPPRLYNQIAVQIAEQMGSNAVELARLLALLNVTMADAAISCWKCKYLYQFWRPITAIREADPGTGPTGLGDGNPATIGDPGFTPLGAQSSNLIGPNFTPPFPAYVSGHATFGGRSSSSFAGSTTPTTYPSPSSRTSLTAQQRTIRELCARSFPGPFRRSPQQRMKTARAGSISASTGGSTRSTGLPMGGCWRITCSKTHSCRDSRSGCGKPISCPRRTIPLQLL